MIRLTDRADHPHPQPEDLRAVRLRLEGELDASNAAPVRRTLRAMLDDGVREVTLDLSDLTFIDAAGLGVLVGAQRLYSLHGARIVAEAPRRAVARVFEVTGTDRIFRLPRPVGGEAAPSVTCGRP